MVVKLRPDDALRFRQAMEPETHKMVDDDENSSGGQIELASIAISLRRIANAMEKQNGLLEALTTTIKTKR